MKQYPIKRVCCVCGIVMGYKDGGSEPGLVSHGYCDSCLKEAMDYCELEDAE